MPISLCCSLTSSITLAVVVSMIRNCLISSLNSSSSCAVKGHPLAEHAEITKEELLSYPQVRFTQDGNNFPYFYEDLIEIPDQETVIYTSDRGTLMNIVLETDAYASGSGIVIGGIREHLRLIPLAEGE